MALLSPGVEVNEVDLSQYVPRLATTVFGIVGAATKGRKNFPTLVTSELDLITKFGPPLESAHAISAMLQYLRRGRQGLFVRVTDGTDAVAQVTIPGLATNGRIFGSKNLKNGVNLSGFPLINIEVDGAGAVEINLTTAAADPTSVTLQEIVDAINDALALPIVAEALGVGDTLETDFSGTLVNGNILPGSFSVTAGAVVAQDNGQGVLQGLGVAGGTIDYATGDWSVSFDVAPAVGPITGDYTYDPVAFKNATSEYLVLESPTTGVASTVAILQTSDPTQNAAPFLISSGVTYPTTGTGAAAAAVGSTVLASSPGTWSNGYSIKISDYPERGTFRITVIDPDNNELPPIDGLKPETWNDVINGPPANANIAVDNNTFTESRPKNGTYFLTGGADGISGLNDSHYIGTINPSTGEKSGLKLLDDPFSLDVSVIAVPGISSGAVVLEGISVCERRQDAIFIVDPPRGLDPQGVADYHNGQGAYAGLHPAFNDSRGALYWPWVESFEPQLNKRIMTPPSGWVAAQMAYTDQVADPWFAPAGLGRGVLPTALAIEYVTDTGQRDFLYAGGNAVNPIVEFTAEGIVIWGQRTLQRAASARDRVNVRRMLNVAGKFIATVTRQVVFEPSDPTTYRRLEMLINPGLADIANRRGIRQFLVRIDETTNSAELVNQNRIGGKIFVEATKAGEFLEFDLILLPSGAEIPGL